MALPMSLRRFHRELLRWMETCTICCRCEHISMIRIYILTGTFGLKQTPSGTRSQWYEQSRKVGSFDVDIQDLTWSLYIGRVFHNLCKYVNFCEACRAKFGIYDIFTCPLYSDMIRSCFSKATKLI